MKFNISYFLEKKNFNNFLFFLENSLLFKDYKLEQCQFLWEKEFL
jgi:hypothetical protein